MAPRKLALPLLLVLVPAAQAGDPGPVQLSRATVPATGEQHVDVTVTRFGRYALAARSKQGVAVQLVDRQSGPGPISGTPGALDGRVDAFLDRGTVRLRTFADRAGSGEARIEANPFTELSGTRPPLLPDVVMSSSTLADLEQRSWWVQLDADEDFAVELAGRALADVRLWRDGQWLDPAAPACEPIAADPGRPLNHCELHARLTAGLYQLTAYGGPSQPWTVADPASPLHIRRGAPTLAEAGRLEGEVGPFGVERWLVPGKASSFHLELPEGASAGLSVRPYTPADPFRRDGTTASITKETMPPVADVTVGGSTTRLVTVVGAAGQRFSLQHFPATRGFSIRGSGPTLFTTLHTGDAGDRPDATGVFVDSATGASPLVSALIPLAPDRPYRRKFNLLGATTLFFDVKTAGSYQLASATPGVKWRWEPLLTSTPKGYAAPEWRGGNGATELDVGRWKLSLEPDVPGPAEIVLRKDALQAVEPTPARGALTFVVDLDPQKTYGLYLNTDPSSRSGLVQRALPADLSEPLPLALDGKGSMTLAVTTTAGTLQGGALLLSVDGSAPAAKVEVSAGKHTLAVTNPADRPAVAAITLLPRDRRPDAPLPPLPDTALPKPIDLPLLSQSAPRTFDLPSEGSATLRLAVPKPGLYRVESTGLLATGGAIRTRTQPVLASGAQNGVGRNFLVQTWLGEGEYQVSVGVEGESAGHLGMKLGATPLREGGTLRAGIPGRATVPADAGTRWRFEVAKEGDYTLRAFGMGRLLNVRLEDAEGWPLLAPGVDGDQTLHLLPGTYGMIVLPEPIETRQVVTFDPVPEPVVRAGHGPHAVALDEAVTHVWWEPARGEARVPDGWSFELLAPAEVTINVDAEMAGGLYRQGESEPLTRTVPGRALVTSLQAGKYRLDLENIRRNSGVTYHVSVRPTPFVPTVSREVRAPARLPVSVGADALVELSSWGGEDVKARLYDATGALVAADDDRPDDWNFRIADRLAPGAYELEVLPVAAASASCRVAMRVAPESTAGNLTVGVDREVSPGAGVLRIPLELPGDGLLVASARSTENLGLAVEAKTNGTWRTVARASGAAPSTIVRLATGVDWQLRLESLDGRGLPATVRADVVKPKALGEAAIAGGASVPVGPGGVASAIVNRARPGLFELSTRAGVSWCPTPGAACEEPTSAVLAGAEAPLWLVGRPTGKNLALRGGRVTLGATPVRTTVVRGRDATVDLLAGVGPLVVIARSEAGQPGLRTGDGELSWSTGTVGASRAALSVVLAAEDPTAWVTAEEGITVDLSRFAFPTPATGALSDGSGGASLAAGAAWRAPVSPGRVELSVSEGLVAVLSKGNAIRATVWGATGRVAETVTSDADTLTMLALGDGVWSARVTADTARSLKWGVRIEERAATSGAARFDVDASPDAILHVRGADSVATFVDAAGHVRAGTDVPLGKMGGHASIRHGLGPWLAWVDRAGEDGVLWGGPPPAPATAAVSAPGRVPLAEPTTFAVRSAGEGLVRVRVGAPVVALVRANRPKARTVLALDGVLEIPTSGPGSVDVALRGLGGTLSGQAEVDVVTAATLTEGLGPEILLAPGASRAWVFEAKSAGPVGVGARVGSPGVRVSVRTLDGDVVSEGSVGMPELAAGRYLLVATLPADASPAAIRPAVVGLTPPDTGPPAEVIRSYLVAAGLLPEDPSSAPEGSE